MSRMLLIRKAGCIVLGSVVLLTGCATTGHEESADGSRQLQRAAEVLAKRPDADSLAAAAVLSLGPPRDESLALVARASALAPDRADLLWLHAQFCRDTPPCDPRPIELHLREVDRSNGAGWLGDLARASVSHDDEARDAALAAIGSSERVDNYWSTLVTHLARATTNAHAMTVDEAGVAVIGILAGRAVPPYVTVSKACNRERLDHADVIEVCRAVAQALQHGDTYVTQMLGVSIAKRVWPTESAQWKAADRARRVFEYRTRLITQLEAQRGPAVVREFLALYELNRREEDVYVAYLTAAGKSPDP